MESKVERVSATAFPPVRFRSTAHFAVHSPFRDSTFFPKSSWLTYGTCKVEYLWTGCVNCEIFTFTFYVVIFEKTGDPCGSEFTLISIHTLFEFGAAKKLWTDFGISDWFLGPNCKGLGQLLVLVMVSIICLLCCPLAYVLKFFCFGLGSIWSDGICEHIPFHEFVSASIWDVTH